VDRPFSSSTFLLTCWIELHNNLLKKEMGQHVNGSHHLNKIADVFML